MKTLEMMNSAERTGKTYYAGDMVYNTKNGFHNIICRPWRGDAFKYLNDLLNLAWEEVKPKEMTLEEVEKELGYKIKIVNK